VRKGEWMACHPADEVQAFPDENRNPVVGEIASQFEKNFSRNRAGRAACKRVKRRNNSKMGMNIDLRHRILLTRVKLGRLQKLRPEASMLRTQCYELSR
jgi:hypothetical protein